MPKLQRTSPLAITAFAVVGLAVGLLVQFARSSWGLAPFVPPVSLAATLVVIGAVVLVLGIALRRAVTRRSGRPVNPFHAVRLLAGARACSSPAPSSAASAAGSPCSCSPAACRRPWRAGCRCCWCWGPASRCSSAG